MEMQTEGRAAGKAACEQEDLSFHWLYQRVQALVAHSIYPKASSMERWSLRTGIAAALVGVLTALIPEHVIAPRIALGLVRVCLFVELAGFLVSGVLGARREIRQYIQPRLSHAREMDSEFDRWQEVIAGLRRFPRIEREQRLAYVANLRASMTERMGILFGGLQRLGPFPLLIALYLQFRDWKWGDWAAAFDVSVFGAVLIFAMALLYLIGWVGISLRTRLDTYVALLESSIAGQVEAARLLEQTHSKAPQAH